MERKGLLYAVIFLFSVVLMIALSKFTSLIGVFLWIPGKFLSLIHYLVHHICIVCVIHFYIFLAINMGAVQSEEVNVGELKIRNS